MHMLLGNLEFTDPRWFWAGALLLPWLIYGGVVSLVDFSRTQRVISLATRSALVLLLSAAAGGLSWSYATQQRFVVLLVDRSESLSAEAASEIDQQVAQFEAGAGRHRVARLEFAQQPGPVLDPLQTVGTASTSSAELATAQPFERRGTDLAAAVSAASAAIPSGYAPHLVLWTDGRQTQGDVLATVANQAALPVSTVPIEPRRAAEVQVSELQVPAQVRVGQPFVVTVVVQATQAGEADLELFRDGLQVELESQRRTVLRAGENRIELQQQLDQSLSATYTARVSAAQDQMLDDNEASAEVTAAGQPRLLLIDQDPATLESLRWGLERQQIGVEVRPPSGLPTTLTELARYDAIGLTDVPAASVSPESLEALRQYVQELGGGLMMLGSQSSFGLGGYAKSPLENILPVRCDWEQEREKPSLAMVLAIDRSGSMGGLKLQLAQDAARGTVELLGPRDQLGLVAFDDQAHWIVPLQSAADKVQISGLIAQLSSAGGTHLYPALTESLAALQATAAKIKHVVLLTDGISAPADFAGVTAQLVANQITLSTVALGDKADRKLLESLAQQGGGRFYVCDDPRSVPQVFAQETMLTGKAAVEETPFVPQVVRATQVLRGIDGTTMPVLLGYVVTRPKPTSEVILVTETGDPLLAWWRSGLGMTLAFTSDAKSRWAAEWLSWPDFPAFWAQLVRHIMRQSQMGNGELTVERRADALRLSVDLMDDDERFLNDAEVRVSVISPADPSTPQTKRLAAVGPGRYAIDLPVTLAGNYHLEVRAELAGRERFRAVRGVSIGYADELRLGPAATDTLQQLARQTGGYYRPTVRDVFESPQVAGQRVVPLWRGLLTAALLLLIADVALRRWDFLGHR